MAMSLTDDNTDIDPRRLRTATLKHLAAAAADDDDDDDDD